MKERKWIRKSACLFLSLSLMTGLAVSATASQMVSQAEWTEYAFDDGTTYTGFTLDDQPSGWGIMTYYSGESYEGQFTEGTRDGYGIFTFTDDAVYKGEMQEGQLTGLGAAYFSDGLIRLGEYENGALNGLGVEIQNGSVVAYGTYEDDDLVINGADYCLTDSDGSVTYNFSLTDNGLIGSGIAILASGFITVGEVMNGMESGKSVDFWSDGTIYIGDHANDTRQGEGFFIYQEDTSVSYCMGTFESGTFLEGVLKYKDGSWEIGDFQNETYSAGSGITSADVSAAGQSASDAEENEAQYAESTDQNNGTARAENIQRAVVRIAAIYEDADGNGILSTGSGFGVGTAWEDTDIFITNWHVVTDDNGDVCDYVLLLLDDADLSDSSTFVRCKVLQTTSGYPDYAILQAMEPIEGFLALPLRSAKTVPVATEVWAYGYPAILDETYEIIRSGIADVAVTKGIISEITSYQSYENTEVLVHDAKINSGNSGGPLVLEDGSVVGINTYGLGNSYVDSSGSIGVISEYSAAVEIDYVMDALDSLGIAYDVYE